MTQSVFVDLNHLEKNQFCYGAWQIVDQLNGGTSQVPCRFLLQFLFQLASTFICCSSVVVFLPPWLVHCLYFKHTAQHSITIEDKDQVESEGKFFF